MEEHLFNQVETLCVIIHLHGCSTWTIEKNGLLCAYGTVLVEQNREEAWL